MLFAGWTGFLVAAGFWDALPKKIFLLGESRGEFLFWLDPGLDYFQPFFVSFPELVLIPLILGGSYPPLEFLGDRNPTLDFLGVRISDLTGLLF